jgi:hypothetical protein
MLWITATLTKNQKSRGSRIRSAREQVSSAGGVALRAAACESDSGATPTLRGPPFGHILAHRGSHAAVPPAAKSSGSPCELIGSPLKKKTEKSSLKVMLATNPLFSLAGPLPEFEK